MDENISVLLRWEGEGVSQTMSLVQTTTPANKTPSVCTSPQWQEELHGKRFECHPVPSSIAFDFSMQLHLLTLGC
jgi:hypothetical protein